MVILFCDYLIEVVIMSSRRRRRKHKIKVYMFKLLTTLILLTIMVCAVWINYVDSICKNVYDAADYYLTESIFTSKKLSKIDSMKLKFSDSKTAVVEVKGLTNDKPYQCITYKAYFSKAQNASWKLDNIYDDSYENKETSNY